MVSGGSETLHQTCHKQGFNKGLSLSIAGGTAQCAAFHLALFRYSICAGPAAGHWCWSHAFWTTAEIDENHVRPNPDVAPHLRSSWSWSWSWSIIIINNNSNNTSSHHDHHHLKFATPYEQYVGWGNSINFTFIRDQNSLSPMNNMLIGVITSTLSS